MNEVEGFAIRPMKVSDLNSIMIVEQASFPTPWSRQAFVGELTENDFAYYYVGEKEGAALAYAGMWIIVDEAHVTNVAVHPHYRSLGLGRMLMLELMRQAIVRGANRITLEVRPSNAPARRLYTRLGLTPAGKRKGYYSDTGEDALIMWKHLFVSEK